MRFFAPTNVYVEKNCVLNHKDELTSFGTKAYLITGRHSARANGSLDDVTSVLTQAGIPYIIFNEIEENPSVETVVRAAAIGVEEKADFVIGIGGGSPLDASKAIALLMNNPEETADCLYTKKALAPALPLITIPTTCGTGAEVTPNAVLTRHALKTKGSISYSIYPRLALVDGRYLESASPGLIINTAADALAHCVESRLHSKSNIYNRMFSEYGLKLWSETIPFITGKEKADADACEKLMLTATVAGMAIAQTGTSLPHALSYAVTYHHSVPHGKACGILLAAYMNEYSKHKPEDVQTVLSILGFDSVSDFGAFLKDLLLPQVTVTEEEITLYAGDMAKNTGKLATCPFEIGKAGLLRILADSLTIA